MKGAPSGDEVDCLRFAICSMLVRCYWCISILIIIPNIRCCSHYHSITMEIEKDNTISFLETSVSRDSDGLLTTSVYRKPTHTDHT